MKKVTKKKTEIKETTDRISYGESVKINIGDYESREVYMSYSSNIKEGETFDKAIDRVNSKVKRRLEKFEKKVRIASQDDVDFETESKLDYYN